jgi:hypothetical protein
MTLSSAANAELRPIVWCRACGHQVEPDPAQLARHPTGGSSQNKRLN